ncbi:MAG: hypothetical protein ACLQGV_20845 [Bryobacteraceae bacterium]
MSKRISLPLAIGMLAASCLCADFSYQQTTQITGGMLKSMAFLSKQAREPIRSTVLVKGDRMATISELRGHIVDLSAETITEIDFQRKTYSVMTFAQMAAALEAMQAKAQSLKGNQAQMQMTIQPSVKETGQTREINGVETREVTMTIEFVGTNPDTNQTGTMMATASDMWLAPEVPGYDEVRSFYRRMGEKLNWVPGGSPMLGSSQGSSKAMAELYKEMGKLKGIAVVQVTKMNLGGAIPQGEQPSASSTPPPAPADEQAQPEKQGIGGALSRLGGFGGLGRKKQDDSSASQGQPAGGPPTLMETTTQLSGFSSDPVDDSKFAVPAGFRQIESPMMKSTRGR